MVAITGLVLTLFLGIAVFIVVAVIVIYNKLVRLRTTVKSSWSDIDVNLKKRYDLVPNLVETVKGYAGHEKSVFENVALARSAAMKATSPGDKAKSENFFTDTLKSLFAVAEAYPQLQATANFMQLQQQLKELEDNIEYARRYYNAVVRDYNIMTETFPSNIVAGQFRFEKSEFFELEEAGVERKPTKVSFS
ncbi:MAG: LemA family protein [Nitrospirota bacterium]|nr:LemA family protein [Nitrospirota bacterium]